MFPLGGISTREIPSSTSIHRGWCVARNETMQGSVETVTHDADKCPELHQSDATAAAIEGLFTRHGAFVIRDFFAPAEVENLQLIGRLVFGLGDAAVASAPHAVLPDDLRHGLPHGWLSWPRMKAFLSASGKELDAQLEAHSERTRSVASACYAGKPVRVLDNFNLIRRHRKNPTAGEATNVPWHRDFTFTNMAGNMHSMNCWSPMVEVGKRSPSLDFILESHGHMLGKEDENPGVTQISEGWIKANLPALPRVTPHCRPGDIVVFDHQVLHRTQQLTFTEDRLSFEFRWAPC
jgi:hypothetical protein